MNGKKSTNKNIKAYASGWLLKTSKPHLFALAVLTILGVLISVVSVAFALCTKNLIDAASGVTPKENLKPEILNLVILLVLQLVLDSSISFLHIRVLGNIRIDLKTKLFNTILKKDWLSVNNFHTGELLTRLNSDVGIIASAIVDVVPSTASLFSSILLSLYVLFKLDKTFAVICICLGPVILLTAHLYRKKFKILHKLYQESDGKTSSFMQDSLQNTLVIKSFGNENKIISYLKKLQDKSFRIAIKRNNISIAANILFFITMTAGYYFAIGYGAYKISIGVMTFGTLTALLQLVGDSISPFRSVSSLLPKVYQAIASTERIIEIEMLQDDECLDNGLDLNKIYSEMKEIKFNNVSFSYSCDKEVLKNLNLSIKKNEFVAISGTSGMGKSTFLKLILGIITPDEGAITIDDKYTLDKNFRKLFSYVPQGNMILAGTIKDNITFSDKEICEEKVVECAKNAQIYDVIKELENGFDTVIGEGGHGLSEGQIQRLAIARALYHDANIILLDEATSALDKDTELSLLKSLKALNSKTLIIVTHRNEVMDFCDRIISVK